MTAQSLLPFILLLGQVAAPTSPADNASHPAASNRYGNPSAAANAAPNANANAAPDSDGRYGGRRNGDEAIERRPPSEVAAANPVEVPAGDQGGAQQPARGRSDLLRQLQAERERYQRGGVGTADEQATTEPLPPPNRSAPPAAIERTQNGLRVKPITPAAPAEAPSKTVAGTPSDAPADAPADAAAGAQAGAASRGNAALDRLTPATPPIEEPRRIATSAVDALADVFAPPPPNVVAGAPLKLADALARRSDRESRLAIAHAYWKLSAATAAHAFAIDEHRRAAAVSQDAAAASPADRRLIDSIVAAADARVHETLLVVVSSQHDLAEAIGGAAGEALPLAADRPFLGAYATRFDEIFADRPAPVQLRAIHQTLPTLHKAIGLRAEAAAMAVEALDRGEEAYLRGQGGVDVLLAALNHASTQRQAFLAVARAYNDDIADYAINVAREGTAAAELTSMLIRVPTSESDAARRTQPPAARSAENPRRGVVTDRSPPAAVRTPSAAGDAAGWQPKSVGP